MTLRNIRLLLVLMTATFLSGCLSVKSYVDSTLPAASKESIATLTNPQPIQMLFEFQAKGAANPRGTIELSPTVMAVAKQSGMFTEISDAPVANQRRLSITINNVAITNEKDAAAKGFGTGLTFGLVGTMVTDGYECVASFSAPNAEPLQFSYKHALHTTIGNAEGPKGLVGKPPKEAAHSLVDQIIWSVMRDLSKSGKL